MTHKQVYLTFSLEEMIDYLTKNGYDIREQLVDVVIARVGNTDIEEKRGVLRVYKDGVDQVPWYDNGGRDYCVGFVFERVFSRRLLGV